MGIAREAIVERFKILVEHRVTADVVTELAELFGARQLAVDQQIGDFDKVAFRSQVFDRVTPIAKHTFFSVKESNAALSGACVDVAFVDRDQARLLADHSDIDAFLIFSANNNWQLKIMALAIEFCDIYQFLRFLFQLDRA